MENIYIYNLKKVSGRSYEKFHITITTIELIENDQLLLFNYQIFDC